MPGAAPPVASRRPRGAWRPSPSGGPDRHRQGPLARNDAGSLRLALRGRRPDGRPRLDGRGGTPVRCETPWAHRPARPTGSTRAGPGYRREHGRRDAHWRRVGRGRARRRRRAPRLRYPGRPQPRDLRRPPPPGPDHPHPGAARAGRGVHGGRLRPRVGATRRRRGDDRAGRDQRADTARRGPRGLAARASPHVGRPQRAGRPGHGRAPRGAEPDRVFPAGQPVGRRPPERHGDPRLGPGRVPPVPDRPARPGRAVDPDRSAQCPRLGAAHAGRRGPAPAVRHRAGGGGGPVPRPGSAAAPRRRRRRDRGRGDRGSSRPSRAGSGRR